MVQQHVSYEFIWIRRTCDYIYLDNVHYCVLFSSRVRLRLGLGLDLVPGWLVVMHMYLCNFML